MSAMVKNEHVIWAYGDDAEGRKVVIFGITDTGIDYLKSEEGMSLYAQPPRGIRWLDVSNVIVFAAKDKAAIKAIIRQTGMLVSEVN